MLWVKLLIAKISTFVGLVELSLEFSNFFFFKLLELQGRDGTIYLAAKLINSSLAIDIFMTG